MDVSGLIASIVVNNPTEGKKGSVGYPFSREQQKQQAQLQ
jgi:hypothetical protein